MTDLVRVFNVTSSEVAGGLRQFLITTTLVARPDICLQVQTLNPYAASVCQRAKDLSKPVALEHKKTAYGETLVKVSFVKAEAVAS